LGRPAENQISIIIRENNKEKANAFDDIVLALPCMKADDEFMEKARDVMNDLRNYAERKNIMLESEALVVTEKAMEAIAPSGMAQKCLVCHQTHMISIMREIPCRRGHIMCIPCLNTTFGQSGTGKCSLCQKTTYTWVPYRNEFSLDYSSSESCNVSDEDTSCCEDIVNRINQND
jgi:hypothetical protein